jgi:4-hydroxythreonine-4-phosphate dehydrogenase
MSNKHNPIIGITLGDINGVGPEVIIKALNDNRLLNLASLVIYGSAKTISYYKKILGLEDFNFRQVNNDHEYEKKTINVVNCWDHEVEINIGKATTEGGKCAWLALKRGATDLIDGNIDAMVTGPINKSNIQSEEFNFPGHTEYLAHASGAKNHLMLMVSEALRVGVATGHIPLSDVPALITKERINEAVVLMIESLKKDFGIQKPRIAVLGLNPHAGEDGLLGREEKEVIDPVINDFRNLGDLVFGPFSADGFFGSGDFRKYDGILAMYHDQGLIPFKSLSFGNGINYSAGLPIIRTSPDHGTGYGIAGRNIASETSLRNAIFLAVEIIKHRRESLVPTDQA